MPKDQGQGLGVSSVRKKTKHARRACRSFFKTTQANCGFPTPLGLHHNLFLAGYPEAARRVWQASKAFATFKPKKITPVPRPPPVDPNMDAMLNLEAARLSNDAQVVLQEEAARTNLA